MMADKHPLTLRREFFAYISMAYGSGVSVHQATQDKFHTWYKNCVDTCDEIDRTGGSCEDLRACVKQMELDFSIAEEAKER